MSENMTLAYLAGIVDGEGYIGIKKSPPRRDTVSPGYHERIQVRMVDEPAIALLAETLGGNYYRESPHVAHGRPLFCYQASDAKACEVLTRLLPYLRVKRPDAEAVLEMRVLKAAKRTRVVGTKNFPNAHGTERMVPIMAIGFDNLAAREALYLRCKALHHA